jgi:chorismate synthase
MPGDTTGKLFQVTNFGESHGPVVGCVVSGCPPKLEISEAEIQVKLDRRRPGQSNITTQRDEADRVRIKSGLFRGKTTGTPMLLEVENTNAKKEDYDKMGRGYRPNHADYAHYAKYGIRDPYGGGRSSARCTVGDVAAGAIAQKLLERDLGIEIVAYVKQIRDLVAIVNKGTVTREHVDANKVRCPDSDIAQKMIKLIEETRSRGVSVGGIVECIARNVPPGLGEPMYDRLDGDLGKIMMSIPAAKSFGVGDALESLMMFGDEYNDLFTTKDRKIVTKTNRSGGIQGGISNGMPIYFKALFKPTATILMPQETVDPEGNKTTLQGRGRHDPCVLPRAVPIVEARTALVLCDHYLRYRAQCGEKR